MIDTHSHLYDQTFDADRPEVISRAKAAGVEKIFLPNEDETTLDAVLKMCSDYPGYCYPMLGFHPECVDAQFKERLLPMKKYLSTHPFVAIGEIGMDLYWDKTYKKEQQEALDIQVQWALEHDLPVMIHCRNAYPELFEVLSPYRKELTGVFHCFEGTPLSRIVLETDAPYLAPVPFRGKRNESSFVRSVAEKLSEIYQCKLSEIELQTTKNAIKVFKSLP